MFLRCNTKICYFPVLAGAGASGGGSGGRIAFYYEQDEFTGTFEAHGGYSRVSPGAVGTIYREKITTSGRNVLLLTVDGGPSYPELVSI